MLPKSKSRKEGKKKKTRQAVTSINAVKMMRDIRDKLTNRYLENPSLEISDLKKVRRKYKIKPKAKKRFA